MRRPDANSASIELPDIASQSPEIQDFLRLVRDRFGIDFDSTMGRVISTIPEVWRGESNASKVAWAPGKLDAASKEMIATCVSAMNACDY